MNIDRPLKFLEAKWKFSERFGAVLDAAGFVASSLVQDGESVSVWERALFEGHRLQVIPEFEQGVDQGTFSSTASLDIVSTRIASVEAEIRLFDCYEYLIPKGSKEEICVLHLALKWLALRWENGLGRDAVAKWAKVAPGDLEAITVQVAGEATVHGKRLSDLLPDSRSLAEVLARLEEFPGQAGSSGGPTSVSPVNYGAVLFADNLEFERARDLLRNDLELDNRRIANGDLRAEARGQVECVASKILAWIEQRRMENSKSLGA
jgi:hypothetical protein